MPTKPTRPDLMTTREIAAYYSVTPGRIRQMVMDTGLRPAMRAGRVNLWSRSQRAALCPRQDGSRHRDPRYGAVGLGLS